VTSPLRHSDVLGRRIRQDPIDTLGVSTQTLAERALDARELALAGELIAYFWDEMNRIGEALFTWLEDILGADGPRAVRGLRSFDPSAGDRARALAACADGDPLAARQATELMRVRYATLHDALVAWIQELLSELARREGDEAVLGEVERAYERLWRPRYAAWDEMTALERLQLSVEGMRGHLSGPGRRGDVGILEEPDRFVMVLDPCGSCGVLRRGDPDSGRPPHRCAGTTGAHPWSWSRTGVGWYAVHSAIVMEYIWMRDGRPPLRPLEGCDRDGPCRWFIYKDPRCTRPEHYERQGFGAPAGAAVRPTR
jgi:hypothetical protein